MLMNYENDKKHHYKKHTMQYLTLKIAVSSIIAMILSLNFV